MALKDELEEVLANLRSAVPEIRGAMVASVDGLAIASSVTGDANRMAAMVATVLGLGKRICDTFSAGDLNETSVMGTTGQVYVYSTGPKGVLAVSAVAGANVGLVNIECRDAAKKIEGILS